MTDLDTRIAMTVYYLGQGLPYTEIARLLRVDPSSISRYIKQAEDRSWVRRAIQIQLPPDVLEQVENFLRVPELETRLRDAYAEDRQSALQPGGVVVVRAEGGTPAGDNSTEHRSRVRTLLAIEAARLLVDLLVERAGSDRTTLGIAWGRSTGAVVSQLKQAALPELKHLETVPLQGGVGQVVDDAHGQFYPDVLAQELSTLFKTARPAQNLNLPAFIDPEVARELGEDGLKTIWRFIEAEPSYRRVNKAYESLNIGLIGIGGLESDAWATGSGYLPDADLVKELKKEGAIGDIACRFYRNVVEDPIEKEETIATPCIHLTNQRAIGISLTQLRERVAAGARIVAIAGSGRGAKGLAIHAAIRNGLISDIVTDDRTARSILGQSD